MNQIGSYVGVIGKARLKSAIVDYTVSVALQFGLYVNRVQSRLGIVLMAVCNASGHNLVRHQVPQY